jgi:hypothetical protein
MRSATTGRTVSRLSRWKRLRCSPLAAAVVVDGVTGEEGGSWRLNLPMAAEVPPAFVGDNNRVPGERGVTPRSGVT